MANVNATRYTLSYNGRTTTYPIFGAGIVDVALEAHQARLLDGERAIIADKVRKIRAKEMAARTTGEKQS